MRLRLKVLSVFIVAAIIFSGLSAGAVFRPGALLRSARESLRNGDPQTAVARADSVRKNASNPLNKLEAVDILVKGYNQLGMLNKAADSYEQGLAIFGDPSFISDPDSLRFDTDYRRFVFNYSQFLLSMGRYDDCISMAGEIEFTPGSEENLRLEGLRAAALTRKRDFDAALEIYDSLLDGANQTGSNTRFVILQNRGFLYLLSGNYNDAVEDLKLAIGNLEGRVREAARGNLALAYSGAGQTDTALSTIEEAISNLRELYGESDSDYIIALRKKGEILSAAGRQKEAVKFFKEFYRLEKNRLLHLLPELSPETRLNYWTMEKPRLSKTFLAAEADPTFALDVALMRRETSLMGSRFSNDISRRLEFTSSDLKKTLKKGEAAVAFLSFPDQNDSIRYAALTIDSKGRSSYIPLFEESMIYSPYGGTAFSLYDHLVSEDPRQKNRLYTDSVLGSLVWQPVLEALPNDISVIHFAPEGIFHLWGIENMPFPDKERFHLVRHFSLVDIARRDIGIHNEIGEEVRLFAGGLDYDDTQAPLSGSVGSSEPNREAYSELRRSLESEGKIFVPLSGTGDEAATCASFMPGSVKVAVLTEEDFRGDAPRYRVLHLATHGYALDCGLAPSFLETDSVGIDLTLLRSGIALTGANEMANLEAREDGILSAREICDLDLSNVDLVVLSACQTAKGLISDESASGLVRALKMAGAKTIVASLWEVDDRSATLFMAYFYEVLSNGRSRQEAIEEARRLTASFERQNQKREYDAGAMSGKRTGAPVKTYPYSKPWYWAQFILIDP